MTSKRLRVFLDTNVLLSAIRGDEWSRRLFTREVASYATYVINPVVLQELLLASAASENGADLEQITKDFELVSADVLANPDVLAYVRQLRNRAVHTNDLLILGSARGCDVLVTQDKELLTLGDAAEVATATPEQFLTGLGLGK